RDERDRRSKRGFVLLECGPGLAEIPEETRAAGCALDLRPGLGADAREPHSGWAHQCLLRGRHDDVEVPPLLLELDPRKAAHAVDHEEGVALLDDGADCREVRDRAR